MVATLEELTKLVHDLKDKVEKGVNPDALAETVRGEITKALSAVRTPERRGQFDVGTHRLARGGDVKFLVHGITPKYVHPAPWAPPVATNPLFTPDVEELTKLNDAAVITAMIMAKADGIEELDTEEKVGRYIQRRIEHGSKAFLQWREQFSSLSKALDTATAAEGAEFVPTGFSRDLIDRVRIAANVGNLFPEVNMPQDPFKLPARAFARQKARKLSESTADSATKITAVTPGTRQVTLDAKKLGVRVLESLELEEDSIIAMAPFIRDEIIEGLAYGLEDAYLNGDDSSTHMDNDTNGGAADLAAKTWIGLRKHAQANSVTQDLSTFNTANLRALRKKLGKYGADPRNLAWIVSIKGLIAMMGLAEVITLDKFGPLATVITGQLAMFDGIPVIVSEEMRDDVAATGVNTGAGPNTLSNLILANRRAWIRGIRRAPTVKTKEDIETDQLIVVVTWRGDFQRTLGTAETHIGQGINFS